MEDMRMANGMVTLASAVAELADLVRYTTNVFSELHVRAEQRLVRVELLVVEILKELDPKRAEEVAKELQEDMLGASVILQAMKETYSAANQSQEEEPPQ